MLKCAKHTHSKLGLEHFFRFQLILSANKLSKSFNKNELDEKHIKDSIAAEITSFEDFLASIEYTGNIQKQTL